MTNRVDALRRPKYRFVLLAELLLQAARFALRVLTILHPNQR